MAMFGLVPDDDEYGGLLTRGDRLDAMGAALRGFGAGILGQGYSPVPRSRFQGLGAGFQQAGQQYDSAIGNALTRALVLKREGRADKEFGIKQDQANRQNRLTDAQIGEIDRKAKLEADKQAAMREYGQAVNEHLATGGTLDKPSAKMIALTPRLGLMDEYVKASLPKPTGPYDRYKVEGGKVFDLGATGGPKQVAGGGDGTDGPFQGNGMDQQVMNVLLKGNPSTPTYAAAYAHASAPRYDLASGQMIKPDMSAFRPPARAGAAPVAPDAAPNAPSAPTPVASAGGPTVQNIPGFQPKMTDSQASAAVYADRMHESGGILNELEQQGTDMTQRALAGAPGFIGNYGLTPEYQRFDQAKRDFVNATLRRESGAVISDAEFKNAERQYFPVPGDTPEVIAQKRANRETAAKGIARAAGPGYKPPEPKKPATDKPKADAAPLPTGQAEARKTLAGKNYVKISGQWYEE